MRAHAGLEPVVFAAHVPNSSSKPLQELIEEIMGDHEMMVNPFLCPFKTLNQNLLFSCCFCACCCSCLSLHMQSANQSDSG